MSDVEVRCPNGPQKLFTKLKLGEEFATHVPKGNLIEFTCRDCSRQVSRDRGVEVQAYHQFNFVGELVKTVIIEKWECGLGAQ